jgi:hypothetical protein
MLCAALALASCFGAARAQSIVVPQDVVVTPVASGLNAAGDLAVDGSGNVWMVGTQGAVGGTGGTLTRVTPAGVVTPNAVTGLAEVGDLVRGQDGAVYFWSNVAAGATALNRVDAAGALTQLGVIAGHEALGIAQDAAGDFYLGGKSTSPIVGIWRFTPGTLSLNFFAYGIGAPSFPSDNEHLVIDLSGRLFAASLSSIVEVQAPLSNVVLHFPIPCAAVFCPPVVRDLDLGFYDTLAYIEHFSVLISATGLFGVRNPSSEFPLASFGPETNLAGVPALGRGIAGDLWMRDRSGNLFRITNDPALLFVEGQGTGQITVNVRAPAGSPFVLAADAQGLEFAVPGIGALHTSFGLLATFLPVADGVGVLLPADPATVTPWSQVYPVPASPINVAVTIEAYVLNGNALNGIVMISNPVSLYL